MDTAECYPEGIGKHIVCIDVGGPSPYKQLVGATPEPHTFALRKEKVCKRTEIVSEMSNILQKERIKLKPTTKQK